MKVKIIYKSNGSVTLDKTTHIYQLNIENGMVSKSDLMELDKVEGQKAYRLIEKPQHLYIPAASLEYAMREFDVIFKNAKSGKIKLSWRERIAKWLIVIIQWIKSHI